MPPEPRRIRRRRIPAGEDLSLERRDCAQPAALCVCVCVCVCVCATARTCRVVCGHGSHYPKYCTYFEEFLLPVDDHPHQPVCMYIYASVNHDTSGCATAQLSLALDEEPRHHGGQDQPGPNHHAVGIDLRSCSLSESAAAVCRFRICTVPA